MRHLLIEGTIGEGLNTLEGVRAQINSFGLEDGEEFNIVLNSEGGSVFEGYFIYNYLRALHLQNPINMVGEGLVGSIATLILSAVPKERTSISEVSMFMIHKALSTVTGNSVELRKKAEILDKINSTLADVYAARTGLPKDEIIELMDHETWFTGIEAKTAGFVGSNTNPIPAEAVATANFTNDKIKQMSLKNLLARFQANGGIPTNEGDEIEKKKADEAKALTDDEEEKPKALTEEEEEEKPKALTEEEIQIEKEEGIEEGEEIEESEVAKINKRLDSIEDSINKFAGVMSNVIDGSEAKAKADDEKIEEVKAEAATVAKAEFKAMMSSLPSSNGMPVTSEAMATSLNSANDPFAAHRADMKRINDEAKAKLKSIH